MQAVVIAGKVKQSIEIASSLTLIAMTHPDRFCHCERSAAISFLIRREER
jgi:hypothetical protein